MSYSMVEDQSKVRRQLVDSAVKMAGENRWEEALDTNESLLSQFGDDVSTYNRLGKALLELGRYTEARARYGRALELDPQNTIARKNLDRLANVATDDAPVARGGVDPSLFVEETGKTAVVQLLRPASADVLGKLTAGDKVELRVDGRALMVVSVEGERLGQIEPKLGLRLTGLIAGGNRYEAAIVALDSSHIRIIIREMFQHPTQYGKVSFPPRDSAESGFRSYIKGSVIHYETDGDDDEYDEGDYGGDAESETDDSADDDSSEDDDSSGA